jgi:hypothetical protein
LARERCLAESRLIKSKIIYKLHQDIDLSPAEEKYRKAWNQEMKESSAGLLDECLVPAKPSSLKIEDLSAEDINALNSLPRVEILKVNHGKFSLNDLCVELS